MQIYGPKNITNVVAGIAHCGAPRQAINVEYWIHVDKSHMEWDITDLESCENMWRRELEHVIFQIPSPIVNGRTVFRCDTSRPKNIFYATAPGIFRLWRQGSFCTRPQLKPRYDLDTSL